MQLLRTVLPAAGHGAIGCRCRGAGAGLTWQGRQPELRGAEGSPGSAPQGAGLERLLEAVHWVPLGGGRQGLVLLPGGVVADSPCPVRTAGRHACTRASQGAARLRDGA